MKIAIATEDKIKVTGNVENCVGFLIFEIENGQIISKKFRENYFAVSKSNKKKSEIKCLAEEIKDCQYLVSLGISWKFEEDCNDYEIKVIVTDELIAETAVINLANGIHRKKNRTKIKWKGNNG